MSLRAVHAGQGYQYLLRSVATHDAPPEEGQALSDYYAAKGTPPGQWIGSGLDGLDSKHARVGAVIGEEQMAALYGEGLHPDTDDRMAAGESLADCKMGRAFGVYTGGRPVLEAIATAEKAFLRLEGRRPDREERSLIAEQIGRSHYTEATGYQPASGADVIAWVNRERNQVRQAVAGFDLTFSPVKSVSVLWGLADEQTASRIAALHHDAVAETLAWIEDNALYTRVGTNGVEQVRTRGMIASEFTHFDTRTGDPDLHSHVLVSNKVQGPDGQWRSIDGRPIHEYAMTAAARYNTVLQDKLSRALGVEFDAHEKGPGKAPVFEIAGIDHRLLERFSSRRILARPVYDRLVSDYTTKHGRPPGRRAGYALWQKAILDTRDAKKPAHSLAEHRHAWREAAVDTVGSENVDGLLDTVWSPPGNEVRFDTDTHTELVAAAAIGAVTGRRSRFRNTHLDTAISAELNRYTFTSDTHRETAHAVALDHAHTRLSVRLSPPEVLDLPHALVRPDGRGVDRRANADWYSTKAVLAAEDRVLAAADTPVAVVGNRAGTNAAITAHGQRAGWSLNDGQATLAHHLLGAGTLAAAGVGPAGTGKTAALAVVADAWTQTGGAVVGLAPSAAAAGVLADDLGTAAHTIDSLTHTWRGGHPDKPARDLAALPIAINRGDMLLVDEAGMATTQHLAALVEIADASGAIVRFVGDPAQLDAVDTGGLFRDLARLTDTVHLREVMRMGADREQAAATLAIRAGDRDALDVYDGRGWVHDGTRAQAITTAVEAFLADTAQGRRSLIIAGNNTDVDSMNEIIRTTRIAGAEVDTTGQVRVARGDDIGVGDQLLARKNTMLTGPDGQPLGRVINGQLFTVTHIGDDHSVTVRDLDTGRPMWLPADYVHAHTHLGYATTVHRAQGATVDTAHTVIDPAMDRASLYVALTRGRHENRLYTVTEHPVDEFAEDAHHHSAGDTGSPTPLEVLGAVVDRDTGQRSAVSTIIDELDHTDSDERRRDLYLRGIDIATDTFTAHTLPGFLDTLPRTYAHQIETEAGQYEALAAAWSEAARKGVDPREHQEVIGEELAGSRRPGAVIAARLRERLPERGDHPAPPPHTAGEDRQLTDWLRRPHSTVSDDSGTNRAKRRMTREERRAAIGAGLRAAIEDGSAGRRRPSERDETTPTRPSSPTPRPDLGPDL